MSAALSEMGPLTPQPSDERELSGCHQAAEKGAKIAFSTTRSLPQRH